MLTSGSVKRKTPTDILLIRNDQKLKDPQILKLENGIAPLPTYGAIPFPFMAGILELMKKEVVAKYLSLND